MKKLVPNSRLPKRYSVSRETVWRWKQDPRVGLPKPAAIINGIEYFDDDVLDAFDQSTLVEAACDSETA
jgi:hypothetical protein